MRRPCRCRNHVAFISAGFLLAGAFPGGSAFARDGFRSAGAKFLTIGGSARALAMGETYLAERSDPLALFYNPAALPGGLPVRLGLAHNAYFQDAHGEYAALSIPRGKLGMGVAMQVFAVNSIPRRTGPTELPLGEFDAVDAQFSGSVSYPLSSKVRAGLAIKGVFEKIDTESASGIAFDLGGTYRITDRVAVGAALNHLGPEMSFDRATYKLPGLFRLGGSYHTESWTARGELVSPNNESAKLHVGGEYLLRVQNERGPAEITDTRLALRAGYVFGYDTRSWAAGFGIGLRHVEIDYAFVPYDNDLGDTHHFGLTFTLQ